eukprot:1392334-Rhodomonas_salina.1
MTLCPEPRCACSRGIQLQAARGQPEPAFQVAFSAGSGLGSTLQTGGWKYVMRRARTSLRPWRGRPRSQAGARGPVSRGTHAHTQSHTDRHTHIRTVRAHASVGRP